MQDLTSPSRPSPGVWLAFMVLVFVSSIVVLRPTGDEAATATPSISPAPSASAVASPSPPSRPADKIKQALDAQAEALVVGDLPGWLAPVDPKLHARYTTLFHNMRAIEVKIVKQRMDREPSAQGASLRVPIKLAYCFSGVRCAQWHDSVYQGAPKLSYLLTWTPRGGSWVITGIGRTGLPNHLQPAPWENDVMAVVKGKRVIVSAPAATAKHIKRILPLAEKAAVVADRYAGYTGGLQDRYRVYIADGKAWKTWYTGDRPAWSIAYYLPLNVTGNGDILLRAGEVMPENDRYVTEILQHEFAHAVTMDAAIDTDEHQWLVEGIAEYIGMLPAKPQNTYSADVLRRAQRQRGALKTIAVEPLDDDSDDLTVDALYATGHLAVGCLTAQYGEPQMLAFINRVMRSGEDLDPAARAAFGKPFKTVDKECVNWIKKRV
ncbi:hypothetical protein [Actinoplanes utahensis]|uniref:Peptidase MA-like domain-containing protein n=1 Tax=Actinoplanes utahensis TaxID=1869 RepID=A0A0A6UR16_ACTUT|nr:hypothetical protein [Actinoplanes utahensis]KHD78580.1 hypothetical protein MB27_05110 [Actinoplanes utahensis]GIF31733.1 hypothetical protein Aut01nite_47190 [Actinoplanes utahensis]